MCRRGSEELPELPKIAKNHRILIVSSPNCLHNNSFSITNFGDFGNFRDGDTAAAT
jgi:hypothetical protein